MTLFFFGFCSGQLSSGISSGRVRSIDFCCKNLRRCNAWCCRYILCPFVMPLSQETMLFLALRKIKINFETHQLMIPCRCRWLNEHNRCKDYAHRPEDCKVWECEELKTFKSIRNHEAKNAPPHCTP